MKKIISLLVVVLLFVSVSNPINASSKLPSRQKEIADEIARIASERYDEFGVLPSIAVAQAFIESTLGDHKSNTHNYFGIMSGEVGYSSLYEGVVAYLRIINNGCYNGAPFNRPYEKSMRIILSGGYCEPVGDYYENAIWSIEHYEFYKYDEEMFRTRALAEEERKKKEQEEAERKEQERKKKWEKQFTLVYDKNASKNKVTVDKRIIKNGMVAIYGKDLIKIADVKKGQKGLKIGCNKKELNGKKVFVKVYENVKG